MTRISKPLPTPESRAQAQPTCVMKRLIALQSALMRTRNQLLAAQSAVSNAISGRQGTTINLCAAVCGCPEYHA